MRARYRQLQLHRHILIAALMSAAFFVCLFVPSQQASALSTPYNWLTPNPKIEPARPEDIPQSIGNIAQSCTKSEVESYNPFRRQLQTKTLCVHQTKSFRIAYIVDCIPNWYGSCDYQKWMVVGFPFERRMYYVKDMPTGYDDSCWQTSDASNAIYYTCDRAFIIVDDLVSHLVRQSSGDSTYYTLMTDGMYRYITDDAGRNTYEYKGMMVSANGKWAVVALPAKGLIRINLNTGELRLFTKTITPLGYGNDPWYEFSITDDGQYIAVGGTNTDAYIYKIDSTCGATAQTVQTAWADRYDTMYKGCDSMSLVNLLMASAVTPEQPNPGFRWMTNPRFSDDEGQIMAYFTPYSAEARWVTITAEGYVSGPKLDYLALGDSYSSGEGDTETIDDTNVKWYRDGTNVDGSNAVPREKCHVSLRSYPYQLARNMGLGESKQKPWRSIACSGATAWDVKGQASGDYLGQDDRLQGFDAERLKTQALNDFIPGRQKQIEFVKKYKPKAITLAIGGNDVDFAGKLRNCVQWADTCIYAKGEYRQNLHNELRRQFDNLKSLYEELSEASPVTRIYVVSYPQFINADPAATCKNIFLLDNEERELIVNSIIYLNNVIEAAAKAAGVTYVDIEDSLGGNRICDQDASHVTAITNIAGSNGNETSESFHPNHLGHGDMARSLSATLGDTWISATPNCASGVITCPDASINEQTAKAPPYFLEFPSAENRETAYYKLTNGTLVKTTGSFDVTTRLYTFAPATKVDITLYSDPIDMGSYVVRDDGSLQVSLSLPSSIAPGYHTIMVRGLSYSGVPILLYQTIEIHGSNPKDIDDDGVDDSIDGCIFLQRDDAQCVLTTSAGAQTGSAASPASNATSGQQSASAPGGSPQGVAADTGSTTGQPDVVNKQRTNGTIFENVSTVISSRLDGQPTLLVPVLLTVGIVASIGIIVAVRRSKRKQ